MADQMTAQTNEQATPYKIYTRLRLEETGGRKRSTLNSVIRTWEALGYEVTIEGEWETLDEEADRSQARYLKYMNSLDTSAGQAYLGEQAPLQDDHCHHEGH